MQTRRRFYRSLRAVKVLLAALRSTWTVLAPRREVVIGLRGEAVARFYKNSSRKRNAAQFLSDAGFHFFQLLFCHGSAFRFLN